MGIGGGSRGIDLELGDRLPGRTGLSGLVRNIFPFCQQRIFGRLLRDRVRLADQGRAHERSSLLYAPLSLVWGLGAMLMTLALFPLARKGNLALFTAGAVLGGGFEYLASLVLELATNRLFWDYSNIPLNLDGRTNLWFALFWGAAAVFWVRIAAPGLLRLLKKIPRHGGQVAALVVAVMLMADVSLSAAALLRMEERDRGAAPSNRVEQVLDTWYSDAVLQVRYQNMQLPVADAA